MCQFVSNMDQVVLECILNKFWLYLNVQVQVLLTKYKLLKN